MSTAHLDWSKVGRGSHPVPGDPADVQATAVHLRQTATRLSEAATGLRRIDSADTISDAVDVWRSNAREVAAMLDLAFDRYDVVADALASYGPVLARAQAQAEEALRVATGALESQNRAARQANLFGQGARASVDPHEQNELMQAYHLARARAEDAGSSYQTALAAIRDAEGDRDAAATSALQRISPALDCRELNDDFGDRVGELIDTMKQLAVDLYENNPLLKWAVDRVVDLAKFVWENIDTIALVLTVVALAISWIPGVGQVALAVAVLARVAAAARIASRAAAVIGMLKAVAAGVRTGNWSGVVSEGLSLALGAALGKVLRVGLDKMGTNALRKLAKQSADAHGTPWPAIVALGTGAHTPVTHRGALMPEILAPKSAIAREADSLISTLTDSYTPQVASLRDIVLATQSDPARRLLDDLVVDPIAEAIVSTPGADTGEHRISTGTCEPASAP